MKVFVIGASNLPAKAKKGSVDPFIRITILPDKHQKFSTKVKRNALSPTFEEEFTFPMRRNMLDGKVTYSKLDITQQKSPIQAMRILGSIFVRIHPKKFSPTSSQGFL